MSHPLFITLEGIEGAGKTSQIPIVEAELRRCGQETVATREPGGTPFGDQIRSLLLQGPRMTPEAELLLLFAARSEHLASVIRPALSAGRSVVCDRFTDATYAYQSGGRGIPEDRIAALETWVQRGLKPDLTLLLDVPVAIGLARARRRSEPDRFEQEKSAFFERVRAQYLKIAAREPKRVRVIDAGRGKDEVAAQVVALLREALN